MNRTPLLAFALLVTAAAVTPGCVVYSADHTHGTIVTYNTPPVVTSAEAYVSFDPAYGDYIWTFDATVDDADGVLDVQQVWADVYDEWAGGQLVESFELYPTDDPYFWYSDWLGSTTFLDPDWDGYSVDFVAYDTYDDFGYATVWAVAY